VTDGSAILGLGNIGPRAGLPVMEGNAALFAALVGISGIPILIESGAVDHFVDVVCSMAPSFGAILLEDISAHGKSIHNVLCFPGPFDAALRARARAFTDAMPVSATTALAGAAYGEQLLPDSLEPALHERVSQAVQAVVLRTGS
jgi:malic enzyme